MKYLGILMLVLITLVNIAQAKPVLVAVELAGKDQIRLWRGQNIPTYEFLSNTAIAEIDDSQIPALQELGFQPLIIDDRPWTENYFIFETQPDLKSTVPGRMLWQKQEVCIIKIPEILLQDLYSLPVKFQPLRRKILADRFWNQLMLTTVPMIVTWDPFIQEVVDQVSTDSIMAYTQRLQDFKSRLALGDSSFAASEWLRQKYMSWGYPTEFDSFYVDTAMAAWGYWPDTGFERNVIASYFGSGNPSKIFLIGGHFDAIVWWDTALARINSPGADDNASGTVSALEAARIFRNYTWDPTIKFVGWAVEELGLYGSEHYAEWANSQNIDIGGVVNGDMIAWQDDAYLDCIIQRRFGAPVWLSDLFCQAGQFYAPTLIIDPVYSSGGSDWYSFAVLGYPSVGAMEGSNNGFNPYYHDTSDLVNTLDPVLFTEVTKTMIATLAILGSYPGIVQNTEVKDIGNGNQLEVSWSQSQETDVIGYNVYWRIETLSVYSDTHFVSGMEHTTDTLNGLAHNWKYYIAVTALDSDDHESYAAIEATGTPREEPLAPTGVTATPLISGIRIDWQANKELDIDGYRVYRRINDDPDYDSMNVLLLPDTFFINAPLSGADKYYYTVRAFDLDGNPSAMGDEVYGRPITLDQGILIVDETKNWTSGNYPHDTTQDNFYRYIMTGYDYTEYEYGSSAQKPILADFGPYSTVLWHADDNIELMASGCVSDFKTYLDYGGNLWFTGWKPTANLRNNPAYPVNFNTGDFMYDYFKIAHVELSSVSDSFLGADGLLGYPSIDVDPAKVPLPAWAGTMRYIEALTGVAPGQAIYKMDMNSNSPFDGDACGLRYLGEDFETCFLGFPLYFMNQEQARLAAQKVMSDFGELGIAEMPNSDLVITELAFAPNMPTLHKGKVTIRFVSPEERSVSIKLYDITGREVSTLFDGKAKFGLNELLIPSNELSTGIYFVQLKAETKAATEKIIYLE